MDHFNATVFDGHMVSTRRGFQVTKQKHQGLAFVNTSAQQPPVSKILSKRAAAQAVSVPTGPLIFITNEGHEGSEKRHAPQRRRSRASKSKPTSRDLSLMPHTPKGRTARLRSPSSASSVSPRMSSRGSFSSTDDASETSTDHSSNPDLDLSPACLPAWAQYKQPPSLQGSYRKLLFMCHAFPPTGLGSFSGMDGRSPSLAPEHFICAAQDPTAIHCGITLGTLYDAQCSGHRETPYLEQLTLQLCSIINRRLNSGEQASEARKKTIHAVATLAILASYAGKWDHWDVHMRGLLHLLGMAGGQSELDMHTISTIRKADFCGAISSANNPCIPFIRRHVPLRYPSYIHDHDAVTGHLTRHLSLIGLQADLVKTIVDAAALNKCLSLSTSTKATFAFDAEAALEHYYALGYSLLSSDGSLRCPHDAENSSQQCLASVRSAMRILTLVYLQNPAYDLAPDQAILFSHLQGHLHIILNYLRSQQTQRIDDDPLHFLLDPIIRDTQNSTIETHKPVLIWLGIAGHVLSRLHDERTAGTEGYLEPEIMGKPSMFKDLLQEVLGPMASMDPGMVSDYDLELCRWLDMRHVLDQNHPLQQAGGDERGLLRFILGVFKIEYSI